MANIPNSLVERGTVTAADCERGQWGRKGPEIASMFSERTPWKRVPVSSLVAVDLEGIFRTCVDGKTVTHKTVTQCFKVENRHLSSIPLSLFSLISPFFLSRFLWLGTIRCSGHYI